MDVGEFCSRCLACFPKPPNPKPRRGRVLERNSWSQGQFDPAAGAASAALGMGAVVLKRKPECCPHAYFFWGGSFLGSTM